MFFDVWAAKDAHHIEELTDQLYSALEEGQYLGRSCPWRPVILKTVFKLLDQESPRLLLKLARLILAVSRSERQHLCSLIPDRFSLLDETRNLKRSNEKVTENRKPVSNWTRISLVLLGLVFGVSLLLNGFSCSFFFINLLVWFVH